MRKWARRAVISAGVLLALTAVFAAYVAYRFFTHGPPALARIPVSKPAGTVRYGSEPSQLIDVRMPLGTGPFPVAVLLHGGCWNTSYGQPRDMAPLADALRQRGIASVNVAYRRVGEAGGGWPGTMRDVGTAIDAVRTIAPRYRLDPARLILVGHSAGAQLALWGAMRDRLLPTSDLYVARPLKPKAVVAIDGPGALAEFIGVDAKVCGTPAIVPYIGGTPKQVPQRYRDATAQDHLPLQVAQYFVRGGLGEYMIPYIARARASGDPVEVTTPSRATHFDILMPELDQGRATLNLILKAAGSPSLASPPRSLPHGGFAPDRNWPEHTHQNKDGISRKTASSHGRHFRRGALQ